MQVISQTAIKLYMQNQGLTLIEFAKMLKIKPSYLKSIIHGKRDRIHSTLVTKIANILKVKEDKIRSHMQKSQINRLFGNDNIQF